MRIAVFSDSHGRVDLLRQGLSAAASKGLVDCFLFLGDGLSDFLSLTSLMAEHNPMAQRVAIMGNCDLPRPGAHREKVIDLAGRLLFACHGNMYGVKMGDGRLIAAALDRGCAIACYGHTHIPIVEEKEGLLLVNPGSIGAPHGGGNTYALIDGEAHGGPLTATIFTV